MPPKFKTVKKGKRKGQVFPTKRDALKYHHKRSEASQNLDEQLVAPLTDNYTQWANSPDRYDIRGIDFIPVKPVKGDIDGNIAKFKTAFEQRFDHQIDMKIKTTQDLAEFAFLKHCTIDRARRINGFYDPEKNEIVLSPLTSDLMSAGKIETIADLKGFATIAHELAHDTKSIKSYTALNEGYVSLISDRWVRDHVQMPSILRKEIWKGNKLNTTYSEDRKLMLYTALIANKGDMKKASEFLDDIFNVKHDIRPMIRNQLEEDMKSHGEPAFWYKTLANRVIDIQPVTTFMALRYAKETNEMLRKYIKKQYGISSQAMRNYHVKY